MENTSYVALSRQTTLWRRMEAVANNLANMNTTGYRGQDVLFSDYLARVPNNDSVFRDQVRFVQDYGQVNDLTQGPLQETGNAMDVAMENPDTFLAVEAPDGEKYTRAGKFKLSEQGQLVTADGYPVLSDAGTPIFVAPNESQFEIATDGTIRTENGPIGKLKVVTFQNPQALKRVGSSLWDAPIDQQAQAATDPSVVQGATEGSNVNAVVEMTKMISVQRTYQQVQELINREDERIQKSMEAWARRST